MIAQLAEFIAVILAIAYLLLAARESILCWYCAFFSSLIFSFLFWDVSLLMESVLNVFYIVMAVVGWWTWTDGSRRVGKAKGAGTEELPIVSMKPWQHVAVIAVMLALAGFNGWFMQTYTSAVWPFVDSFTTWASVITTFMVVYKVLENWLYWIVIDSVSIYLYLDRGLYLTALLFGAYVIIVIFGYVKWRRHYLTAQCESQVLEE